MRPQRSIFIVVTSLFLWLAIADSAWADSPPNLTTPIEWPANADIVTAFNQARRGEEAQFGLPNRCYGDLVLPTGFSNESPSQRAMILMNQEREARAGMCGTNAEVLGKPFELVESTIEGLSQYYADFMIASNATGHSADGFSPFERIDNDPIIGNGACNGVNGHQFIPRAENIYMAWTSQNENPDVVERAIYAWIYDGASAGWGHREMIFLQNTDLNYNAYGFSDDFGVQGAEGFIGVGVSESPTYNPFNWSWVRMGTVVVLNYFDPQPETVGCLYDFDDLVSPTPTPTPTNTPTSTPTSTNTPTPLPTTTPMATNTPTPTPTLTPTAIPPTSTPQPDPTPTPEPPLAEMLFPIAGSVLPGDEVTFTWTDADTSYLLYVGSSEGVGNYYSEVHDDTTAIVYDLPTDGAPIYVRLWSEAETWGYNDYVFTAASEEVPPTAIELEISSIEDFSTHRELIWISSLVIFLSFGTRVIIQYD